MARRARPGGGRSNSRSSGSQNTDRPSGRSVLHPAASIQEPPRTRGSPPDGQRPGRPATPPGSPQGPKPRHGQPGADTWRYDRYKAEVAKENAKNPGQAKEPLPFDTWRKRHYETAASGGRPGRPGGPSQVAAKDYLRDEHGVHIVEDKRLGGKYPDGYREQPGGGTDYFEVGKGNQNGLPEARERDKLVPEVDALGSDDRMFFVDHTRREPENWIEYRNGDDVHNKRRPNL